MNYIHSCFFVLTLVLYESVQSKKICDFADSPCMTRSAQKVFKTIVPGIRCMSIKSADPMYEEDIRGEIKCFNYELMNLTLTGISKCDIMELKCNKEKFVFEYGLRCPQLVLKYNFKAEGVLGSVEINGHGEGKVIADDYVIIFKGKYGLAKSDVDQEDHIFIDTHHIDTDPKGRVTFEVTNGSRANSNKINNYLNDNWREMEKLLRFPVIDRFMASLMKSTDTFLRNSHLEEVIPAED